MALSIGVSVGSQIDIGDEHTVTVKSISNPHLIVLSVKNKVSGDPPVDHLATDQSRAEIIPDVFVSTGDSRKPGVYRLAFEAPKQIRISRIEHLRE